MIYYFALLGQFVFWVIIAAGLAWGFGALADKYLTEEMRTFSHQHVEDLENLAARQKRGER